MPHFKVTEEAAFALGKTSAELEAMTLGQFRELAYYRGFDIRISGFGVKSDDGSLTVRMDSERRPIVHIG